MKKRERERALQEPGQHSSVSNGPTLTQLLPSGMTSLLEYQEGLRSGVSTLRQRYSWVLPPKEQGKDPLCWTDSKGEQKWSFLARSLNWQVSGLLRRQQQFLQVSTQRRKGTPSCSLRGSDIKIKSVYLGECSIGPMLSRSLLGGQVSLGSPPEWAQGYFFSLSASVILGSPVDKPFEQGTIIILGIIYVLYIVYY